MSKPTRKELAQRIAAVEQRLDQVEASDRRRATPPSPTRLPREVVRRPWPLRWWDQLTGLWGCSWVILAAVILPVLAAGRWWL